MGIEAFIANKVKQTVVYWGNPQPDGYGGNTFDIPVEIDVRWQDKNELFINTDGEQTVSSSIVYSTQDVDEGGFMYLGVLDDLDSDQVMPEDVDEAKMIRKFEKSPSLNDVTQFVRKIYL